MFLGTSALITASRREYNAHQETRHWRRIISNAIDLDPARRNTASLYWLMEARLYR
jgi:hypothetical protein